MLVVEAAAGIVAMVVLVVLVVLAGVELEAELRQQTVLLGLPTQAVGEAAVERILLVAVQAEVA